MLLNMTRFKPSGKWYDDQQIVILYDKGEAWYRVIARVKEVHCTGDFHYVFSPEEDSEVGYPFMIPYKEKPDGE